MPARNKPTIADELLDQLLDGRNAQEAFHDGAFSDDLKQARHQSSQPQLIMPPSNRSST
jgi:hypothetical protein